MGKIKVVSIAYGPAGRPVVVDDKGRVWIQAQNTQWVRSTDLPNEPDESAAEVNEDLSSLQ